MAKGFTQAPRSAAERLRSADRGELLEELRLNGEIALGGTRSSSTALCVTTEGLFLVLLRADDDGVIDLLRADRRVRYRPHLLGDRLEVDHWSLSVPWGRAEQAQRIIGLARIRQAVGPRARTETQTRRRLDDPDGAWAWSKPFVDDVDPLARAWLRGWLDADERLLVWATTDEPHSFESPLLGSVTSPQILVITERRQGLVAISPVGDVWTASLPDQALEIEARTVGRALVRAGDHEFHAALGDERSFTQFAALPSYLGAARLRELARVAWLRARGSSAGRAMAILAELASHDPLARLTRALLVDPDTTSFVRRALAAGEQAQHATHATHDDPEPDHEPIVESRVPEPAPLPDPVLDALRDIVAQASDGSDDAGAALVDWWADWQLGPELGERIVEHLCELGPAGLRLALPLHERLHPILQAKLTDDPEDAALLDFVLAEHLLALGQAERALELLRARKGRLPSEQLHDLLPPSPARGGQAIRIELHELLVAAHEQLGDGHVAALAELARLQPLVADRIEQLLTRLESRPEPEYASLRERAERVRAILDDDGFTPMLALTGPPIGDPDTGPTTGPDTGPTTGPGTGPGTGLGAGPATGLGTGPDTSTEAPSAAIPTPLADPGSAGLGRTTTKLVRVNTLDSQKLELLRHPAARIDGVLGRLQGALAKVAVPDCSVLKSYCERANLARNTALAKALTDATMVLGLGGVEVFVSRGDKSVGMRAYEGGTSFLLIGGDHLNPNSDAYLDEASLRFAVAAELAHLRYAHSRVTSDEVWAGTFDLGLTGLGMLIVAAPILTRLKAPAKHLLDKVGAPAIDRWRKKLSKRDSHSLVSDNSQVIAAHRAMQLSADRAGLLVSGDPVAAIRAMFAVNPAHLSSWPLVLEHGLRAAITRELRADDLRERDRLEDLAVRVAALLSFYLSDEYALLRAAGFPAQKS